MCTHEHSLVRCYGTMSAHECWWAPAASCRYAPDCFWTLMSAYCSMAPSSWVFMDTHESSLAIRNTHGCSWLLISAHECQWVLMSTYDSSWKAVRRSHEHSWAWGHGAMSTHESSKTVMSMVPWSNWHSLLLMSAYCAITPYLWVLISAHERTWVLLRVHECWTAQLYNRQKNVNFSNDLTVVFCHWS